MIRNGTVREHIRHTAAFTAAVEDAENAHMLARERDVLAGDHLDVQSYATIEQRDISWLWYPYLPLRSVVSMEGNPGEGKSWVSLALAASASRGTWPALFNDGRPGSSAAIDLREPVTVLHINVEDSPEETIKKRLVILGADCTKIFCVRGTVKAGKHGEKRSLHFTIDHLAALTETITQLGARLVILDPIQAYLPRGTDMNKAESVRPLLAGLMGVANRTNCTILIVRHFGKRLTETALYKAIGSIDFAAAVRSVLIVGLLPRDQHQSMVLYESGVMTHAKSNLAPRGQSLKFELRHDEFLWGGVVETSASDLTSPPRPPTAEERERSSIIEEAMEFLLQFLRSEVQRSIAITEGAKLGFSRATIDRAARRLRVKSRVEYDGGRIVAAYWSLPGSITPP